LPLELGKDVVFLNDIIYVNQNNEVRFYSSKCTHLGCKINTLKNDYLACGCHGSLFSLEGKVLNGPASTNLKSLGYIIDTETQEYIVKLG
jgi:cytochrome b6-f complex iron-sulfur subunit